MARRARADTITHMSSTDRTSPAIEPIDRDGLTTIQLEKLQRVISSVLKGNTFYQTKLRSAGIREEDKFFSLDDFDACRSLQKRTYPKIRLPIRRMAQIIPTPMTNTSEFIRRPELLAHRYVG